MPPGGQTHGRLIPVTQAVGTFVGQMIAHAGYGILDYSDITSSKTTMPSKMIAVIVAAMMNGNCVLCL